MAQIIKHRRGSLESLSAVTSSLQKGEIIIASGSSNISASNGSSIIFAVVESGSIQAVNRVMRTTGSTAPTFASSTYNGMVDGVPFYASGSSTLYLLGSDTNEAINLVGNIQPYSASAAAALTNLSQSVYAGNIWQLTGSAYNTINNLEITGAVRVSGTIDPDNVTVGIPTSNAWQTNLNGSYFNNFTSETNVSEILRFVAGLLSASAPDASPNTKTFNSVTATAVNTTTGTVTAGSVPQTSTNSTIIYLNGKGFATAGSTIFSGISPIYTSNLGYNYTSVSAGSTVASSSADAQLFGLGLLSSGNPTSFTVSGSFTFRFKDNSSKTDTATSQSVLAITQTGAGTTSGASLAKINTVNPAVIPPGYQDGKFASTLTQYLYSGSVSAVSASGYYHISSSIRINSGSSAYSTAIAANGSEIFYAPLTTISTNVPANTISSTYTSGSLTAVSRSLSGAPYLSQSTYYVSGSTTELFNPLYHAGANLAYQSTAGTGMTQTSGVTTVSTVGGTIQTANAVYDSTGTTVRATSTIPYETDIVKTNALYTFGGTNITNVGQSSNTPTTWTATINANNKNSSASTYATSTFQYHIPGTFGQPVSSGSMAYFTRLQSADASTALVEGFTGEAYRIQLGDNVLAFNGTAWTTTFGLYNLGATDLQVKPGYLVKPGGTYGYWLGNPSGASDYKYYIRKFTTSGTKTSMTLNLGKTLVNWGATTNDSVAAGILFESSKNTIYTPARIFDPSDLLNNFVATKNANTDGQNPFGANFDLYGNTGGSLSTTTYTIPLRNGDGMTLNATYTNIYVIVRYKGDPAPVTSITTTFS